MKNQLYYGDNLEVLRNFVADESVDLRMNLPLPLEVLKSAELKKRDITESLF